MKEKLKCYYEHLNTVQFFDVYDSSVSVEVITFDKRNLLLTHRHLIRIPFGPNLSSFLGMITSSSDFVATTDI